MVANDEKDLERDPEGGHDPAALEEAADKMKADHDSTPEHTDPDPEGTHDPAALEEAARKMGVKR